MYAVRNNLLICLEYYTKLLATTLKQACVWGVGHASFHFIETPFQKFFSVVKSAMLQVP